MKHARNISFLAIFIAVFFAAHSPASAGAAVAADIYVSPSGNDSWAGNTPGAPFATLARARDEAREIKKRGAVPGGGITVCIAPGDYLMKNTFLLEAADSGQAGAPVVYRRCGDGESKLIGGAKLDPGWFAKVSGPAILQRLDAAARGNVFAVNLREHGIDDYGEMRARGFGREIVNAGLELFFQGRPMQLARTPNKKWGSVNGAPDGPDGSKFNYTADSPNSWASFDDVWVHGYWTWDWADSYAKVKSIDTAKHIVETYPPHGVYGYKPGARFRFINVLEEIDSPGEWYLDRKSGVLYFWPPSSLDGAAIYVSMLEKPIVTMDGVSHAAIRGMTIEITRGAGVSITGGAGNLIAGCEIRNTGTTGVLISGGEKHGVAGSNIYETGDGGVIMTGGDRKTLTAAGHFVDNNDIHDFSRWSRTYRPGVLERGVGNIISRNDIHDAPHVGILLNGNDHIIEYNKLRNITWETSDVGGFYLGRDWTERGNIVRHNFFHKINGNRKEFTVSNMMGTYSHSVYMDDCACGTTVYGNVFVSVNQPVFIGGGRDNIVENNIFVDSGAAVRVDARCLGWASATAKPGGTLYTRLEAMNHTQPPYSERYPGLADILNDEPAAPKGNIIARNIAYRTELLSVSDWEKELIPLTVSDNMTGVDPLFADAKNLNFQLRDDSPAYKTGFKKIPFESIGPRDDENRRDLPKRD